MGKRNKGFTLVELLAVIVVLAIIAIIAVPQVVGIVESSNQGAFKDSASGLLEAAELYYTQYAGQNIELDLSDKAIIKELSFKGTPPKGGTLYINKEGLMALKMYDDKYCAYKSYSDKDVTVENGKCEVENLWKMSTENLSTNTVVFPKTFNGVTIDYDPETQIFTYNGTSTANAMYSEFYIPASKSISSTYSISVVYVGGKGATTAQYPAVGLDLATKTGEKTFSNTNPRAFLEVGLYQQNKSATKTLTYPNLNDNSGYKLFFYFREGGIVFKDFQFKVMLNVGSPKPWTKNLFTTIP